MTITTHDAEVVATAVSVNRSIIAEVDADGCVCGVRLLTDAVKRWDTRDLENRIVAVAEVAHNRYLAGLRNRDGRRLPTLSEAASDERKLRF